MVNFQDFQISGFEMMASLENFETLGEIDASQNAQYENLGFGNWSQNRRFLSTKRFGFHYSMNSIYRWVRAILL